MTVVGWLQIIIILALVLISALPLSSYIARVLGGERTWLVELSHRSRGVSIICLVSIRHANKAGLPIPWPCSPSASSVSLRFMRFSVSRISFLESARF